MEFSLSFHLKVSISQELPGPFAMKFTAFLKLIMVSLYTDFEANLKFFINFMIWSFNCFRRHQGP